MSASGGHVVAAPPSPRRMRAALGNQKALGGAQMRTAQGSWPQAQVSGSVTTVP